MKHEQNLELGFEKLITYYSQAVTADDFALAIRRRTNKRGQGHADVELAFLQEKGNNGRVDVVAALRMQVYQLEELHDLIEVYLKKLETLRGDEQ